MATADDGVRYRNKVTIITGGARGIGRACVELFVKHGSKVVFVDILEDLGKEVEESLKKNDMCGEVLFIKCDISNEQDVQKMIETTIDIFGQIDCVINNAAYYLPPRTLDNLTTEEFTHVLGVNVLGAFSVSKYAIKHLRITKGNIINISSMTGVHGRTGVMAYGVSKAGIIAMTRNMAIDEAKNGVRVNCVSPAGCDTPLLQSIVTISPHGKKFIELYSKHAQFMGRISEPVEVAKTCLYLATDATYSTGQNICVSGGDELDYGFKHNMQRFYQSE